MDVNKILGIIGNHDGDAVELAKSLGGALEKRRAKTAVKRAGGQELPKSKFMPNVPRQVHADGGWVEHYEFGGAVDAPQKTVKAYKLFRKKGDNIYPLFVDANTPVPVGQWISAKAGDPGKDPKKVKSKLGDLAYRPGWHAGDLPIATHIGGKSDPKLTKPDYRPDEQVWAEIEMPDDVDWQSVANERAQRDKSGNIKPVTAHITDQVPHGGHYRYKTNPNMTGNWLIGGSMKVNRILSDDEVQSINNEAGVADLPRLRSARAEGGFTLPKIRPSTDDLDEVGQANFDHYDVMGAGMEPIESLSGGVNLTHPNQRKRVEDLKAKISHPEEGYISRIIVDDEGNVIEGQHRFEALKQLGATHAPVVKLRDKTRGIDLGALREAVRGKGGISSDHVNQIANMAIDSTMESGHPAKAREEWEAPQGFEGRWHSALTELERQFESKKPSKAEGGEIAAPPAAMHEPHRRAEEQGYSIKGYHVTRGRHAGAISSAQRFDPEMTRSPGENAVFFWDNPEAAREWAHHVVGVDPDQDEEYSDRENDRMDRFAPATMPVRINKGKHLEVNWPEETGMPSYDNRQMAKVIRQARAEGYDTIRIKNMLESDILPDNYGDDDLPYAHDQIAVLNPAMIRSEFAEYDPRRKGEDNIGAAKGGAIEEPQYKTWHDVPTINPQDLVGKRMFPIFADLTKAGDEFKGIDSVQIAHPEKLMGGPSYPLLPESQQHGLGWAVEGKGRGSAKIRKDADYVVVSAMEPFSHQSNATFANALTKNMLAYAANGRISKANLKKLNAMVRKESEQKELQGLQDFPGFEHPDAENFIRNASFEQRGRIADIIGSREAQDMGAPNMEKLTRSTLDPEFSGVPSRHGLFLLEIPKGSEEEQLVNLKEAGLPEHPSYKYGIKGRIVGRFAHPVAPEVPFKDWFDQKKAEQKEGKTNIRRAFDLAMPVVTVSQEVADMLPKDAKDIQSGKAAKLALNAFNDQWHDTETPVNQGGLGPAQLSHALKNSDMSATLSQYTPDEIKKMAKEGKFTGYKLKDGEVYFGLKRGTNYAEEYGFEHPELSPNETALVSVVNNEMGAKGIGGAPVVLKAIKHGATALDAFAVPSDKHPNGFLPDFYSTFGFQELGRIPFDPKYVTKEQFDDMKHEWRKSGWDEQRHGLPSIAIMKWKGNENDRSDAVRRFVTQGSESDRAGAHPVDVGSAAGTPERSPVESAGAPQGERELGDVGRDLGSVRTDRGSRPADRFTRTLAATAKLSPTEAQHFGISPEDIAPVKQAFGFKNSGSIDISHALEVARRAGNNGDTILAHINPQEAAMLKRMGGSGTINPKTGLPQFGVDDGPEAGSTGSAAGNSYGGGYSAAGGQDSPSESSGGPGGTASWSGGGGGGSSGLSTSGNNSGSGSLGSRSVSADSFGNLTGGESTPQIGFGSLAAFGRPEAPSTFGHSQRGPEIDEQLARDYAGFSAPFLAGMTGTQLAKDYMATATGNSPLSDYRTDSYNLEASKVSRPPENPTIRVDNNLTNKQIAALFQPQPTTATTSTTPVQAAAEAAPNLSDIMGTTPQGNYLFSGMDVATNTVPNTYTVDPNSIVQQVRTEWPTATNLRYGESNPANNAKLQADIIGGLGGYGLNFKGNTLTGDINSTAVQDALKTAGVAQSSFKPVTQTTATTNWGAPSNMASYPVGNVAPQGFADMYGVSPSQTEATQYAQPSRPVTPTPSTAYAQPQAPSYASNLQPQQTVRQNFDQAFADARRSGAKTFYWQNPKTGQMELYTTQLRAAGGRTPDDRESMIRRALEVAFRYGS